MAKTKRNVLLIILAVLIVAAGGVFVYIKGFLDAEFRIKETVYIYVDKQKNFEAVLTQMDTTAHVSDLNAFKRLASYMKYPDNMKTGRYAITPDMSIQEVISDLKGGHQAPVKLKFNNIRTKADLAKRLASQLMLTEEEFMDAFNSSVICSKLGFTPETITCMFVPNTYEVYWDVTLDSFLKRMKDEYSKFWTSERLEKAKAQGLTPIEVSILASIVEEECYFSDEYPVVAGLYLNRLRIGQLLQADPTVKFAVGDFSLKRILFEHLQVESPYNTYKHLGLPPGPIRVASIKGIDAVLNAQKHGYLYMCAKEDFSGRHNFAVTHAEHVRNANRYRAALNQRKIY